MAEPNEAKSQAKPKDSPEEIVKKQAAMSERLGRVGGDLLFAAQVVFVAGTLAAVGVTGTWGQVVKGATITGQDFYGMGSKLATLMPPSVSGVWAYVAAFGVMAAVIGLMYYFQHKAKKQNEAQFVKKPETDNQKAWDILHFVASAAAGTAIGFMVVAETNGPMFWTQHFWKGWGKILSTTFVEGPAAVGIPVDKVAGAMGISPLLVVGILTFIAGLAVAWHYNKPTKELTNEAVTERVKNMGG